MNKEYFKFSISEDTRKKIEEVSHAIAGDIRFTAGDPAGQVERVIEEIRKKVEEGIPMMVGEMVSMINSAVGTIDDGGSEDEGDLQDGHVYDDIYEDEEPPAIDCNGHVITAGDKVIWTDPQTGDTAECTVYGEATEGMVRLVGQYGEYEVLPSECELIIDL